MWRAFDGLKDKPLLVVRGANSDILAPATAEAMRERVKGCDLVTVPETGHAPTLDEPEAAAGVDRLLARIS
jgi:pimeloyl-ACP methyl ester carboxylesterase